MKKKLLLIGGASLIGSSIINQFKHDYELHLTFNETPVNSDFPQTKLNLLKLNTPNKINLFNSIIIFFLNYKI